MSPWKMVAFSCRPAQRPRDQSLRPPNASLLGKVRAVHKCDPETVGVATVTRCRLAMWRNSKNCCTRDGQRCSTPGGQHVGQTQFSRDSSNLPIGWFFLEVIIHVMSAPLEGTINRSVPRRTDYGVDEERRHPRLENTSGGLGESVFVPCASRSDADDRSATALPSVNGH